MRIKQDGSSRECQCLEGCQKIKASLTNKEPLEYSLEGSEETSYKQSGGGVRSDAKALRWV